MGNAHFISPWIDDPDYIINLTKNVIGERVLARLTVADASAKRPRALLLVLTPRIADAVMKMTSEVLGRICAYGTEHGFHDGPPMLAPFLNLTGFRHVLADTNVDLCSMSGREHLMQLAIYTIVCVARDIAMQDEWLTRAGRALESDGMYDREMERYIHGGHR